MTAKADLIIVAACGHFLESKASALVQSIQGRSLAFRAWDGPNDDQPGTSIWPQINAKNANEISA
jgi:hypothetical protein